MEGRKISCWDGIEVVLSVDVLFCEHFDGLLVLVSWQKLGGKNGTRISCFLKYFLFLIGFHLAQSMENRKALVLMWPYGQILGTGLSSLPCVSRGLEFHVHIRGYVCTLFIGK